MQVSQSDRDVSGEKSLFNIFVSPANHQPKSRRNTPKRKAEAIEKENKQRPRTPSGQVLTTSVSTLRNRIEKGVEKAINTGGRVITADHENVALQMNLNFCALSRGDCSTVTDTNLSTIIESVKDKQIAMTGKISEKDKINGSAEDQTVDDVGDGNNTCKMKETADVECNLAKVLFTKTTEEVASVLKTKAINANAAAEEDTNAEDYPSMDVRTVIKMLAELKLDVKQQIHEEILSKAGDEKATKKQLLTMSSEVGVCQARERMMIDTMAGMAGQIQELQEKLEIQEMNMNKRTVILSGFEAASKKVDARLQLEDFMDQQLGIQVVIEDFYYIGNGEPREIVISLLSTTHKHMVMKHKSKLKDLKNSKGKKMYFRDFLSPRQLETEKTIRQIKKDMEENQVEMEDVFSKGQQIFIGEEEKMKIVTEPDPTQVLRMSIPELNEIMMMQPKLGKVIHASNNKFTGYSLCTNSSEEIQKTYMKIRLNHAEARHIICVWRIPGVKKYLAEDFCDDGDHGIGRMILEEMQRCDIKCRAIFVVRNTKEKMCGERYRLYKQCVHETLCMHSKNDVTGEEEKMTAPNQENQNTDEKRTYAKVAASPPMAEDQRGRGRGRGRGDGRGGRGWRNSRGRGEGGRGRGGIQKKRGTAHKAVYTKNNST